MKAAFFKKNRTELSDGLHGGLIVIAAYAAMQRSNDASFQFEQEANFWYLSGIEEPDWWLIIDGSRHKSWLVAPSISNVHRTFEGELSPEAAMKRSGVDDVISMDEAERLLRDLAKKHSVVYTLGEHPYKEHFNFVENPAQKKLHHTLERTFNTVQDCRKDLAELRAIKQPEEVAAIKKAIRLTMSGFELVKQKLPTLTYEYSVEAEFDYHFKKAGAQHAYAPIVAGGKNACTLHYGNNDQKLKSNSFVLMDIGARVDGYAADITRTFAKGEPTKRQREVHMAVETAHRQIVNLIKPLKPVEEYQKGVDSIMSEALRSIGLSNDEAGIRRYMPHAVSHGLGVDVHDSLGAPKYFQENMVLTVEPGIYIPEESIGIRIEDDILITASGRKNLSEALSTGL